MRPIALISLTIPLALALMGGTCASEPAALRVPTVATTPETLERHCDESIGEARVEKVAEGLFVAIGYDLANTVVLSTPEGRVVVDPMMSPERAQLAKDAIDPLAPGPTRAVIYTHSHIDHIGGASVWLDEGTEIWATDRMPGHFVKQYGVFQQAETLRGARQFGRHVGHEAIPCSALGRQVDFDKTVGGGIRMPTRTFSGEASFEVGGVRVELHEAHGETDDQLFVWIPAKKALLPGDNYYRAFPNLYTIRGTRARPIDRWIDSLDRMRRKRPELLLPSHTIPVKGAEAIAQRLTDYRDAMAYLLAETARGANQGKSLDEIVDSVQLPAHLAERPYLLPLYGEVHWSVRAMYVNDMGWFDGHTEHLYPLPARDRAAREVKLMGGEEKLRALARQAVDDGDPKWALHLIAKLERAGSSPDAALRARAERAIGERVFNTNGRGYLLQSAFEHEQEEPPRFTPKVEGGLLESLPPRVIFQSMASRLISEKTLELHETLEVELTDVQERYFITIRRGVAEITPGEPLPGTPEPFAKLVTTGLTWKKLALRQTNPVAAVASGELTVEGSVLKVPGFMGNFDTTL